MKIVNNLRFVESRNGLLLTTKYVSSLIGISEYKLEQIEQGYIFPSPQIVSELAKVYGYPIDYFYERGIEKDSDLHFNNIDELSAFDRKQILDFLEFHKNISYVRREDLS